MPQPPHEAPLDAKKINLGHLKPWSCSFGLNPQIMTIGEGGNQAQPVIEIFLIQLSSDPPVDLPFHPPLTREDPDLIELLHLGAGSHPRPGKVTSPFPDWGSSSQIWRCWFSSQPLHIWLSTAPARVKVSSLMKPSKPHHRQKAQMDLPGCTGLSSCACTRCFDVMCCFQEISQNVKSVTLSHSLPLLFIIRAHRHDSVFQVDF